MKELIKNLNGCIESNLIKEISDQAPDFIEFMLDEPTEEDKEDNEFWKEFNLKYPDSNNKNIIFIYQKIESLFYT